LPLVIALAAGTAAAGVWMPYATPVPAALLLFVLWFFRDPNRRSEAAKDALIAPADGRVVEIARVEEPEMIGGQASKVAIFMSVFDVHVNRAPYGLRVKWIRRLPGKFLNAIRSDAGIENERCLLAAETDRGPVLVKLIAGLIARRIVCRLKEGDRLERGQRLGMIKFGSRVEVFVPAEKFETAVKLGQRVRAGDTVLGHWR
jgi:phosphatidylserine decarboxylase